jgi:hypothetical protein
METVKKLAYFLLLDTTYNMMEIILDSLYL